jgi:hypothetical protein
MEDNSTPIFHLFLDRNQDDVAISRPLHSSLKSISGKIRTARPFNIVFPIPNLNEGIPAFQRSKRGGVEIWADNQTAPVIYPLKADFMYLLFLIVVFYATILSVMNTNKTSLEPIVDSLLMKVLLENTSDKRGKIARMIHSGDLFQLRRGLYTTRRDLNPLCLAASIYGPSYISFETALSYYGLIPEAVYEITSATLKRPNEFQNMFGRFHYRRVPENVYSIGIERVTESGIPFLIASPTKAVCDRIALEPRMRSMSDVKHWTELMRLDEQIELDPVILDACAETYKRPAVRFLQRTVEKYGGILP